MSIFQIKIFALVAMTIGHAENMGLLYVGNAGAMIIHFFGKMAAPLFLFALVEGLKHTRDVKKYVLRLYAAWVFVGVLNTIMQHVCWNLGADTHFGNIFGSYFFVAYYALCLDMLNTRRAAGITAILASIIWSILGVLCAGTEWGNVVNILLPSLFGTEYSMAFVALGVTWCLCKSNKVRCTVLIFFSLISACLPLNGLFSNEIQLMLPSIIIILLYNGEKGRGAKYLFYIFYPMHQYILAMLSSI